MSASEIGTQYATFIVGELFFGIDVLRVQEVLRYQEMTRVPLSPVVAEGLINLRGQIVTALDMRRRLALPPRPPERLPMNLVVRADEGPVSLLVDEIGDVLQLDQSAFEAAPDNVSTSARDLIRGVYKLKDRLLLVLDPDKTLDVDEFFESRTQGSI
ncbi:MAG TPA: chemotaxis protein CheW [Bryobacteraceae bacterium]|nr:chemotaxis protein CheW [Bryobacteraceae bacterium]